MSIGGPSQPPPPSIILTGLAAGANLPRASSPLASATNPVLLAPALKALAAHVKPRNLTDCGGDGECGPCVISWLVGLLRIADVLTQDLRARVVASMLAQPDALTCIQTQQGERLSIRKLATLCMSDWPAAARAGLEPSLENWCERIGYAHTWTDIAFVVGAADHFLLHVHIIGVNDVSHVWDMGNVTPCGGRQARGFVELGCWYNRHFVAITDCLPRAAADHPRRGVANAGDGADPPLESAAVDADPTTPSLSATAHGDLALGPPVGARARLAHRWPLTRPEQVQELLAGPNPPTIIVCFEFTAAVRSAEERKGNVALSADRRACEIGGMHYQGDVQDIIHLAKWAVAYFFPPCFQQLRGDLNCLEAKIADGRAFWGCVLVLWCICCAHALKILVEQPDTIANDFFEPLFETLIPDAQVVEFRTIDYDDELDKFVRLTMRNAQLPQRPPRKKKLPQSRRSHLRYANPDERDRQRSTWMPHRNTCEALVRSEAIGSEPAEVSFLICLHAFAALWHEAGYPVPRGYDALDGQPPSAKARQYQLTRGPGDGRVVDAVLPSAAHGGSYLMGEDYGAAPRDLALQVVSELLLDSADGDQELLLAGKALYRATHPAHPLSFSSSTGTHSSQAGASAPARSESENPIITIPCEHTIDLTEATANTAALIYVCVLIEPLVLAHVNGFTAIGVHLPPSSRPIAMKAIQALCSLLVSTFHIAFMIGEYVRGARVFAAPVDFAPPPSSICRTASRRRLLLAGGAAFVWCTLSALEGTPIKDAATRAVVGTSMFLKPTGALSDAPFDGGSEVTFKFGATELRSVVRRPLLEDERSPPIWAALAQMTRWDSLLASSILDDVAAGNTWLHGWAESISPLDTSDIPPGLADNLPDFKDGRLDEATLPPIQSPLNTRWYPMPPAQEPADSTTPRCPHPSMMLTAEGLLRVRKWLEEQHADLLAIRDGLLAGIPPDDVPRSAPSALAVGQSEMVPWARRRVWDCRSECCVVADFRAPISSNLQLDYIRKRLLHYPDQFLVSNLLEGVRLDANVELQLVLNFHLSSLPRGFASVEAELRRLHKAGWYSFFADFPFFPMYINGQGAVARKLEARYRRTTEGGGPRRYTADASGLQAISINDASHVHHMPQHFREDQRPEFLAWLAAIGLPAPPPPSGPGTHHFSKWPKERKPQLEHLMRALAVLKRAAFRLDAPLYSFGDDAKDFFNQLAMSASDLHKLGILFLAQDNELGGGGDDAGKLLFVSEHRLGFGTHGASNVAQRFSDSALDLYREDMDAAEEAGVRAAAGAELEYLRVRLQLQRRRGEPCVPIHRWSQAPEQRLPDIAPPDHPKDIPEGYVCPQLRLYAIVMFTDDPQALVVGVARCKRALTVWRQLTHRLGLIMAIAAKRSLGAWSKWLGVIIVAGLGIVLVPRDKILRAAAAINATLGGTAEFGVYRSLCGLLEHLRAINLNGRNVMHGLYRPHGPQGESRHGPSTLIKCNPLMIKQLSRWLRLLAHSCGVSVKRALLRHEIEAPPSMFIDVTGDACYADVERAAAGGFCHGLSWFYEVREEDRWLLSIPVLEFFAMAGNVITFHQHLRSLLRANDRMRIVLRTDALTTALTLPEESMKSPLLVAAFTWLRERPEWKELCEYLDIAHLFGDGNPFGDLISRKEWEKFYRLCAQTGIRPTWVTVPTALEELYGVIVAAAAEQAAQRPGPSAAGAALTGALPLALFRCGGDAPASPILLAKLGIQAASRAGPSTPERTPSRAAPQPGHSLLLAKLRGEVVTAATARAVATTHTEQQASAAQPRPNTQFVGGLALPPPPPPRRQPQSSLALAGRAYAQACALAMANEGDPDMRLRCETTTLLSLVDTVQDAIEYGVNANTAKKEERAWDLWESVCHAFGTTPLRSALDAAHFPQRNALLLSVLTMHAYAICHPRMAGRQFIKPKSALAYPLAIIRVFSRWGVVMPSYKMLKAQVAALSRQYLAFHGPYTLAPRRVEPMKFSMVRRMDAIKPGSAVGRFSWSDEDHHVFIFRRLSRFMSKTGFRLGEIVSHSSGEAMYLLLLSLTWRLRGIIVTRPSKPQLQNLRKGDMALVAPNRAKPDPWGEIHCPFPVVFTYDPEDDIDVAGGLRDIEIWVIDTFGGAVDRAAFPLFADASGKPYNHSFLDSMLRIVLTFCYGAAVAQLYTWHSYRSGLATALHAAGVPDAMIQLICRWMCPESLHAYRRMGTREHEKNISQATKTSVDSIQSINVPRVSLDGGYKDVVDEMLNGRSNLGMEEAFEQAVNECVAPAALAGATIKDAAHHKRRRADDAAQPTSPTNPQPARPVSAEALVAQPAKDQQVLVPHSLWPSYHCAEYGGDYWAATVLSSSSTTAVVRFTEAKTRDGRPYENVRLPWSTLHSLRLN